MPPRTTYRRRPQTRRRAAPATVATHAPVAVAEQPVGGTVMIPPTLTVRELSEMLDYPSVDIIKVLLKNGVFANINQTIDFDTAAVVATDIGFDVEEAPAPETPEADYRKRIREEDTAHLRARPPVVTIMGHVDHGKTSLLDAIRSTNVTAREAGGITQHIGAYQVELDHHKITFLDTPGHQAFTSMRARGAHVTDVAVIVVAADDGVMPQTVEAIDHAKAAGVPIVVAINKIDRPDADQERVKRQLAEQSVLIEEWGGDTICVGVSASTRDGLPDLLEQLLLVAEVAELKANPTRRAEGMVIEGQLEQQRGPVATLLVQTGTLRVGDTVLAGESYGKIRAMYDDHGEQVRRAEPAMPVKVLGLSSVPLPGDSFAVMADDRLGRITAEERIQTRRRRETGATKAVSLQDLFGQIQSGEIQELNVLLKADVQGSLEPIRASLEHLGDENLRVKTLRAATGNVTESDVMLALASGGIILAFNTRVEPGARRLADQDGVEIRSYEVIYNVIEDVEKALKGLLAPTYVEVVDGHAVVRQLFKIGRRITVAGCAVTDGKVLRNDSARIMRGNQLLATDKLAALKRFKDDAREVLTGFECGITMEKYMDFREDDTLEFFHQEQAPQS